MNSSRNVNVHKKHIKWNAQIIHNYKLLVISLNVTEEAQNEI